MGRSTEHLKLLVELMTAERPEGRTPPPRPRVLVVGDEADVAQLVRDNLFTEHWGVFTSGSDADALESVSNVRPDVVLLDTRARRLRGWEVRRLKEHPETRAIPVIVIAGGPDEGDRVLGSEVGADAIVILS